MVVGAMNDELFRLEIEEIYQNTSANGSRILAAQSIPLFPSTNNMMFAQEV